jgi:uncharacterized protein (UPF0333 family)
MNMKGQGALEYLLLIGGAVLIAAVVLSIATGLANTGQDAVDARATDALCSSIPEDRCGCAEASPIDPDGGNTTLGPNSCTFNAALGQCIANTTAAAGGLCP